MSVVGRVHSGVVFGRRVAALARALDAVISRRGELVDVGCGDGSVAWGLAQRPPDLGLRGLGTRLASL